MDSINISSWNFALFSANVHHFNPHLPWSSMEELYSKWMHYHEKKHIISESVNNTMPEIKLILSEPSILCLYHLGYHAQIPYLLAYNNIMFDILIDHNVFVREKKRLEQLQNTFQKKGNNINILFSDDIHALLKARTSLKTGRHLVIFADGNSGVKVELPNRVQVNFLNRQISVRKGIALLSYLLKANIIPLIEVNAHNGLSIKCGEEINPSNFFNRHDYIYSAMQELYYCLQNEIVDSLHRWEGWAYLHEMNCFEMDKHYELVYDDAFFESSIQLKVNGKTGYFDRRSYKFITNEDLTELLI